MLHAEAQHREPSPPYEGGVGGVEHVPSNPPYPPFVRGGQKTLFICGASTRAAAVSALRAGLHPWCADLFADADLQAVCPVIAVPRSRYPEAFIEIAARQAPPGPWLYTGGLENRPALVERISQTRPLWGTPAEALGRVRDPFVLAETLNRSGLHMPPARERADGLPVDGSWLVKPLGSAGGTGIRSLLPGAAKRGTKPVYFQERVAGQPHAAAYLSDGKTAQLFGLTRQLVGEAWLHARPFSYCGSVGPVILRDETRATFDKLGSVLVAEFGLRGVFGVDCVLSENVPWVVEVNPRYPASVEVLEHALEMSALAHCARDLSPPCEGRAGGVEAIDSAGGSFNPPLPPLRKGGTRIVGKAILFAKQPLIFPTEGPWQDSLEKPPDPYALPAFADIPQAGRYIKAGWPVLTFFARGRSSDDCLDQLKVIAADLDRRLWP